MGNSKRRWLKPDIGRPSLQNPSSSIYDNLVIHRQAVADLQGMPYIPRHTLRSSHAWHAYCTSRAWNALSFARVDSPAYLTVTYDSIEETHRMQGQPTNEYSLLEGLVEYRLQLRRCYICIYCSEIDQHQYHVSASYIRIVLHAIFQLCTPTSTA